MMASTEEFSDSDLYSARARADLCMTSGNTTGLGVFSRQVDWILFNVKSVSAHQDNFQVR